MTVFDEAERTEAGVRSHSESAFAFLNRVGGPFWDRTRSTVEAWFSRLPDEGARADIRGRLRSRDNEQFRSAFWELYVHESLHCEGFKLTPHPAVPGTTSRPDFLAERDDVAFYLEATVTSGPASQTASERRRSVVYDSVNQLDSPDFILLATVHEDGPASPSGARLRQELARWLAHLAPDDVAADFEASGRQSLPRHEWQTDGWRIVFTAFPKGARTRGEPGAGALGAWGPAPSYVDDVGQVRRDLEEKASKYGTPDLPFIVAVSVVSPFYDGDDTMLDALFGSDAVQFSTATGEARQIRRPDGLWRPNGARYKRVSAVIAARHVMPWHVTESEPVTWHNPWAALPMPDVLPWESRMVDIQNERLIKRDATRRAHEILRLPKGWPGPEDPLPTRAR